MAEVKEEKKQPTDAELDEAMGFLVHYHGGGPYREAFSSPAFQATMQTINDTWARASIAKRQAAIERYAQRLQLRGSDESLKFLELLNNTRPILLALPGPDGKAAAMHALPRPRRR